MAQERTVGCGRGRYPRTQGDYSLKSEWFKNLSPEKQARRIKAIQALVNAKSRGFTQICIVIDKEGNARRFESIKEAAEACGVTIYTARNNIYLNRNNHNGSNDHTTLRDKLRFYNYENPVWKTKAKNTIL